MRDSRDYFSPLERDLMSRLLERKSFGDRFTSMATLIVMGQHHNNTKNTKSSKGFDKKIESKLITAIRKLINDSHVAYGEIYPGIIGYSITPSGIDALSPLATKKERKLLEKIYKNGYSQKLQEASTAQENDPSNNFLPIALDKRTGNYDNIFVDHALPLQGNIYPVPDLPFSVPDQTLLHTADVKASTPDDALTQIITVQPGGRVKGR